MRPGLCALFALSACYAPNVVGGAPCDPGTESCPGGQTCKLIGAGYFCTAGTGIDGGIDTPPGAFCYGSGLLGPVCFAAAPSGGMAFPTAIAINTATVGAGNCTEIRAQPGGGPSLCIVAASTIEVITAVSVRGFGPNALVMVAAQTLKIGGTLDASSHVNDSAGVTGPGARGMCNAPGIDGATSTSGTTGGGGGGGAGGSFSALGGLGGNGQTGAQHGNPTLPSPTSTLVGGCPGGRGGHGNGICMGLTVPCGGGPGGIGGGAVYLIAGDAITVSGSVNASGQGGAGGTDGFNNSGGGGGGGAGGMIGLDAPHITVTGSLYANGGGGGGGGGSTPDDHGQPGSDPTSATVAATGGAGGQDNGSGNAGGAGGAGSVGTTAPGTGRNGTKVDSAGGGGGGGAGLIRIFGVPASSVTGTISPPAT